MSSPGPRGRSRPAPALVQPNRRRSGPLTSAPGDVAHETTTAILPGFLAVLGVPAAALGIVEGIADAVASFAKVIAGHVADRFGRGKARVLPGHGLTPVGQVPIAPAAGWPLILLGRIVSWFGKGLRGSLRDAIVAQSITRATLQAWVSEDRRPLCGSRVAAASWTPLDIVGLLPNLKAFGEIPRDCASFACASTVWRRDRIIATPAAAATATRRENAASRAFAASISRLSRPKPCDPASPKSSSSARTCRPPMAARRTETGFSAIGQIL